MNTFILLPIVWLAVMGFTFLIVGAHMANWNNNWNQSVAGVFVFITGCGFITVWALSVVKYAVQTAGL